MNEEFVVNVVIILMIVAVVVVFCHWETGRWK